MRTKYRRLLKGFKPIQTKVVENLNYYLGISVGENIVNNFLPTLSTDSLKTERIITVSDEETEIWNEMDKKWYSLAINEKTLSEESTRIFYENLKWYKKLEEKYLPNTIEIRINKVKPTDIVEFKRGIEEILWGCDLSHYSVVDGFFDEGHEFAWCSTITLTRHIEKIPEKYL